MSEQLTEIPMAQYKALEEHDPEAAKKFKPVDMRPPIPNDAPQRFEASDLKKAEEAEPETTTEPEPEPVEEPAPESTGEDEDLGDGLRRRKVNGTWHIVQNIYGKEELIPQKDWGKSKQSESAITQGWQSLRQTEREMNATFERVRKELEDEKEAARALNTLLGQTSQPSQSDPFEDLLGTGKPAAQPVADNEVARLKAEIDSLKKVVSGVTPFIDQNRERQEIAVSVQKATELLADFGMEAPKDWNPIANEIALQYRTPAEQFAALKDPVLLARAARSHASKADSFTIAKTTVKKPPVTTTVHKTSQTGLTSELAQLEKDYAREIALTDGDEGRGPDGWKHASNAYKIRQRIYELKAQKSKE